MQLNRKNNPNPVYPNIDLLNLYDLQQPFYRKVKTSKNETYVVISDLHLPYINYDALKECVADTKDIADTIVLAGDVIDGQAISNHAKLIAPIPLKEEVGSLIKVLHFLLENYKNVVVITGNHDRKRFKRTLFDKVPSDFHFLIADPIKAAVDQFKTDRIKIASNTICEGVEESWFHILGKDCIITHGEIYKANNAGITNVYTWFNNHNKHLKWVDEIRCLTQGHTHSLSSKYYNDVLLMESGCMVDTSGMAYAYDGNCRYQNIVKRGYLLIFQENGITNLKKSRIIPVG